MGRKIDSIIIMRQMGLPVPGCVFAITNDNLGSYLDEYFKCYYNTTDLYTIRTDTEDTSMSCKRKLSATRDEVIELATTWQQEGFQIILQQFIDEQLEVKSGNIYLLNDKIIIEGAMDKHHNFTNGMSVNGKGRSLDTHLSVSRFDTLDINYHLAYPRRVFTFTETMRLIRLARKIPYTKAIVEFSFFKDERLYFWEIKKEK